MRFALYGAESVVDEQFKIVKQTLEAVEGERIIGQKHPGNDLPVEEFDQNMKVQACVPDMSMLKATDFIGTERGGHMTFSSLVPLTGRDGACIRDLVKQRVEGIGLDFNGRIKDALDPKGILSPGEQGIWPRRLLELDASDR